MTKRPLKSGGYSISPDDSEYEAFEEVWRLNAIANNAHMHKLGFSHEHEIDYDQLKSILESRMEHMLDGVQEVWFRAIDEFGNPVIIDESTGLPVDIGEL